MNKEKKQTEKSKNEQTKKAAGAIAVRGRAFQGKVIRKFEKRVTIELERTVKIAKFERFMKKKTRIHARLPEHLESQVKIGDFIKVQECRPLSKIIHFAVTEKIRDGEQSDGGEE